MGKYIQAYEKDLDRLIKEVARYQKEDDTESLREVEPFLTDKAREKRFKFAAKMDKAAEDKKIQKLGLDKKGRKP